MPLLDSYYKVPEAAALLGVHPETVKRLCQRGRIPAEKVHNTWLIQKEKLGGHCRLKLPRDVGGEEVARLLGRLGYQVTRQTGSHMRLTRMAEVEHRITIPRHSTLKVGTLNSILKEIDARKAPDTMARRHDAIS